MSCRAAGELARHPRAWYHDFRDLQAARMAQARRGRAATLLLDGRMQAVRLQPGTRGLAGMEGSIDTPIDTKRLVLRRLRDDWQLILSIFSGILVATTLISGAPVYLDSLARQSIATTIDSTVARRTDGFLTIVTHLRSIPVEDQQVSSSQAAYFSAIERYVSEVHDGTQRHLKTPNILAAFPGPITAGVPSRGRQVEGFFQYYSTIEQHVSFLEGRMAGLAVRRGTEGPMLEAVISQRLAVAFDDLRVGEIVVVSPFVEAPVRVSVRIVGVFQPIDPSEGYWQGDAEKFVSPRVPDPDGNDPELQPLLLGMFVTKEAMIGALDAAFPGAVVDSTWYGAVDPEALKRWPSAEMRQRMDALQEELAISLPGSTVRSGVNILLRDFERRSFLSSVPLLLLLTVLGVTVVYFLFMIVSYLVPNRESDVALFRSRGTGVLQLLKLYLIEGALVTGAAVAVAPFLAMGVVALAGKLPYFRTITDGNNLPVELSPWPFAMAAGAGLLCLAVFVVPGVLGARSGVIIHRLSASRPPELPFVQRYYVDYGLLAIGGVLFWELRARGELVSGGLFSQPDVNEALLLAPVLFLIVVGLLFFRLFPMFVRFISGESPSLAHLATVATLGVLGPALAVRDIDQGTSWVPEIALLVAVALAYWVTVRSSSRGVRAAGIIVQTALIGVFLSLEPPDPDQSAAIFTATITLAVLVPAQLLFYLFRRAARAAPVWVSMTLWHMARNPLQYIWLVLLLVLVSGIGVLTTTVGATIDRSKQERVRYDVGADLRVSNLSSFHGRSSAQLRETYGAIPGVGSVSLALRGRGRVGAGDGGDSFTYMCIESDTFDSWFRDDFSDKTLSDLMAALRPVGSVEPLTIPDGAAEIGLWVNPGGYFGLVFVWIVVQDSTGRSKTVTLGRLGFPGWHMLSAELPDDLQTPLRVVSILLNEPGYGAVGTVGHTVFDDLHVVIGATGEEVLLEGFEDDLTWTTLTTSAIDSDELYLASERVHTGDRAAVFDFGKETNRGVRGFYRGNGGGVLPVIASSSFADSVGSSRGSRVIVNLPGGLVPVEIRELVDYFPTVDPAGGGFLLFDLDTLVSYVDALNPVANTSVNDVFLLTTEGSTTDGNDEDVLSDLVRLVRGQGRVMGAMAQLESLRSDPLASAGWRAMVLIALGVILFTAGLGYVVYLSAIADHSAGEIGLLRSLGLSRLQLVGLVGLEHLLVAMTGLSVGAWAGFQISRLTVSSVAVADAGGRVLPPFILTTEWSIVGPLYGALAAIILVSLLTLGRRMLRLDPRRLSRMEG